MTPILAVRFGAGSFLDLDYAGETLAATIRTGSFPSETKIYRWTGFQWINKGLPLSGAYPLLSGDGDGVLVRTTSSASVYQWASTTWVQRGASVEAEGAYPVAATRDLNTVVFADHEFDRVSPSMIDAGRVVVKTWDGSTWQQVGQTIVGEFEDAELSGALINPAADRMLLWGGNLQHHDLPRNATTLMRSSYLYEFRLEQGR